MGRLAARKIAVAALKALRSTPNRENKDEERLKKKEIRKQSAREKDYGTAEEKEFCAALLSIQLKIRYMDGDGNCMFRSIADQLTGSCSNVRQICQLQCDVYSGPASLSLTLFFDDHKSNSITTFV